MTQKSFQGSSPCAVLLPFTGEFQFLKHASFPRPDIHQAGASRNFVHYCFFAIILIRKYNFPVGHSTLSFYDLDPFSLYHSGVF